MTDTPIAYQTKVLVSPEERDAQDVPIHVVGFPESDGVKLSAHLPEDDGFAWLQLDRDAAKKLCDQIDDVLSGDVEEDDGC